MVKTIAVIGATGSQGGSLVNAILGDSDDTYAVRALTRNPNKDSALLLKKAGAEVVEFDMDHPETYQQALEGVYGLFVVTNYWEHFVPLKEREQATAVAKAAEQAGVQHIVWSTLDDTTDDFDALDENKRPPKINGCYVPHLDEKARSNKAFPQDKTTFLYTSFQLENFYQLDHGVFYNNAGDDTKIPVTAVEDIGKSAYAIFKAGDKYKGKQVGIASDKLTSAEMMAVLTKVTGKPFKHTRVDRETYAGFGFPGADALANMYQYITLHPSFADRRDVSLTKSLNPEFLSIEEWAGLHKTELLEVAVQEE